MIKSCFSLLFLVLLSGLATASDDESWCGFQLDESGITSLAYDYGDSIRAKFIFVGFPADSDTSDVSPLLHVDLQPAVVDSMKSWLKSHSQGRLQFTHDTGILFRPGSTFEADSTALSWHAELPAADYRNVANDLDQADYRCRWGEDNEENCDEVIDISKWRVGAGDNESITFLMSEILYKIYDSYVIGEVPENKWPFGERNYSNDDGLVDLLFFIFLTQDHVWTAGGSPGIAVNSSFVEEDTLFSNANQFFSNIAKISSGEEEGYFQGTQQKQNSSGFEATKYFDIERCAMVVLHEFSHTLGFRDGPPHLDILHGPDDIGRYYYDNLNIMNQHFMPGRGVPVIGLFNLEKTGWVETIDFTGQNRLNKTVYDLRGPQGKMYKFQLQNQPSHIQDQYFLFGYHAGRGVDSMIWPGASEPVLLSTGLEVQHVAVNISGSFDIVDIESAFGLYRNISSDVMPVIDLPPFPQGDITGWGTLAPIGSVGYDNYDLWWVNNDSTSLRQRKTEDDEWLEYSRFLSQKYDFFTADTLSVNDAIWTSPEFSYRSNPNCFWYSDGVHSGNTLRHNPQTVPNSMIVRIKEQHDDADPPYMIVDFISVPFGEVTAPAADVPGDVVYYTEGDSLQIQWITEFPDAIDRVDIFLSKNGGISYPVLIGSDIPVDSTTSVFNWLPGAEDRTNFGRIKVVFKNQFNEETSESLNPDRLIIGTVFEVYEDFLYPENGEIFVVDDSCSVEWANFNDGIIDSVSIYFSVDNGNTWDAVAENLLPGIGYQTSSSGNSNIYPLVFLQNMSSKHARFKMEYFSANGAIETDQGCGSFVIIPAPIVKYVDVTAGANVEYEGEVYNFNSLDVPVLGEVDDFADLFISFESSTTSGQLYQNTSYQGTIEFFEMLDAFEDGHSDLKTCGAVSGDLNNDGNWELVIASPAEPRVYHYDNVSGQYVNWLDDEGFFGISAALVFMNSYMATLVDFDHDGDLDIYLGRASNEGGVLTPMADALFEQRADGHFVDIADSLGLASHLGVTQTAVWCDFDEDGWWEVVVGDAGNGPCMVYDQNSDGFTVRTNPFPAEFPVGYVIGLQWFDLDKDDDFDLLVTRSTSDSWVLLNESGTFGSALELPTIPGFMAANGVAVDFDMDGWVDIVQTNLNGGGTGGAIPQARLLRNFGGFPGFSGSDLYDQVSGAGLGAFTGEAAGLLFDDFDKDGGLDALVGRPTSVRGNLVFHASPTGQGQDFQNNWIAVDLVSAADNQSSLGAVVTVKTTSGEILGKQVVDGGSSRGGQQPKRLLFGLGTIFEPIEIEATWPSNPSLSILTLIDPSIEGFNQVVTLVQGSNIEIHQGSISVSKEIVLETGLLNYEITWTTNRLTEREGDKVYITDGPTYENPVTILYFESPDAVVLDPEYTRDETGETSFHHRVKWRGQPCVVGYKFKFVVESCIDNSCISGSATNPIVRTKVCITQ